MPRQPREKSETGLYHVMVRGVNKELIFKDDEDRKVFLQILKNISLICSFKLLAYCLMGTHVHLLIQEEDGNLSVIMKRLCTRFVRYFNRKYERVGHLVQNRFKSEKVETEQYLLTVLRYIHQNPVKAHMVDTVSYPWSSHNAYMGFQPKDYPAVDTDFILSHLADNKSDALKNYKSFMGYIDYEANCLEYEELLTDTQLEHEILSLLEGLSMADLHKMNIQKRNEVIKASKKIEGVSIRQISRVTGIGRYIIENVR